MKKKTHKQKNAYQPGEFFPPLADPSDIFWPDVF
jgi:hypothetical protein